MALIWSSHHPAKFGILQAKCSVRLKSQTIERQNVTKSHSSESGSNGKNNNFDLLLQSFVLKQLPLPFLNTAQAVSGGLGLNAATRGYRTGNTPGWDTSEMQVTSGRHSKWLKHQSGFSYLLCNFGTSPGLQ